MYMDMSLARAYAEVDNILSCMETRYVDKVPKKLRDIFKYNRLKGYNPIISKDIPLNEQKLERKTFAILAMLDLQYWCENEVEKQELLKAYSNNDKKHQEELNQKYNSDDLFKNKVKKVREDVEKDEIINKENIALTEIKEDSFIKKIIKKIKLLFKK
ncbi:MAG: hypothetical protein IKG14_02535 [Clostridia bacterium]|nr:hypothetical protein [Clostridia bacterium]